MCNCGARRRAAGGAGGGIPGRSIGTTVRSAMATGGATRRVAAPPSPRTPPPRMINGIQVRDTSVWGAALWEVLHGLAEFGGETIPFSDWQELIVALQTGLPCPDCSTHFQRWCRLHPLTESHTARRWLLDLHNDVNRRLRKELWTVDELTKHYSGVDHIMEGVQMAERVDKLRDLIGPAALEVLKRMASGITDMSD